MSLRRLNPVEELFDPETGEITEHACPGCLARDDEIRGLKRNLATEHRRYGQLARDKEVEAHNSPFWGVAVALFQEWKIATNHWRSGWTIERYQLCQPFLERERFTACRYAVWGIAAAPNRKQITIDYEEVYDSWELVFRNQSTFERYANRGAAIFGRDLPIPGTLEVPDWLRVPRYARLSPLYDSTHEKDDGEDPAPAS